MANTDAGGVPFFMYEDPSLDHSWLSACPGFHEVRSGVRMQNTAEVGAAKVFRRHPLRVLDPQQALLFFVPVFTYVSKWVSSPCRNSTGHRQRMAAAAATLSTSPQWQRFRGRDHFFVSTTWSTAKTSFRTQLFELAAPLSCGVAGRYKQFCAHACTRRSSALASCTVHAPYAINPHTITQYRRRTRRPLLVSFSGSVDVCCTGTTIRCRLGDYVMAGLNQSDVLIRPSLPANATTTRSGACTEKALQRLGEELARRLAASASTGADTSEESAVSSRALHRQLAIAYLSSRPRLTAVADAALIAAASDVGVKDGYDASSHGRRLTESWREAAVGQEAVRTDARIMASSVFCFTPAGDTCVAGRFYSAVAAGCIPVVACRGAPHPVAFEHLLRYDQFWVSLSAAEWDDATTLLQRLRRINATEIKRYQSALERHRADVLYDVPNSRVGSNLLNEMLRTCYSKAALADYQAHRICNVSDTAWPPRALGDRASAVAGERGADVENELNKQAL